MSFGGQLLNIMDKHTNQKKGEKENEDFPSELFFMEKCVFYTY